MSTLVRQDGNVQNIHVKIEDLYKTTATTALPGPGAGSGYVWPLTRTGHW